MTSEFRYQIIFETPSGREALSFYEIQLDSIEVWGCYPEPLYKLREIKNPQYGCGQTPQLAFEDLLWKKENAKLIENEITKVYPNSND